MESLTNGADHSVKIGKLVSVDVQEAGRSYTVNGVLTATWDTYPPESGDLDDGVPTKTALYIGGSELRLDWYSGKIEDVKIEILEG